MKEWFGSSIVNKAVADANETDSITEEAQANLFQPSMGIHEFLENESFEVHFDTTTDYNTPSITSSLASCDINKLEKMFQINKAMSQKIDEFSGDVGSPVSKTWKGDVANKENYNERNEYWENF